MEWQPHCKPATLPFSWCQRFSAWAWLPFLCPSQLAVDGEISPFSRPHCPSSSLHLRHSSAEKFGQCFVSLSGNAVPLCVYPGRRPPWELRPVSETWTPFPAACLAIINQAVQIACFARKSTSANACVISCCLPRLFQAVPWSRAFSSCPGCWGNRALLLSPVWGAGCWMVMLFQRKSSLLIAVGTQSMLLMHEPALSEEKTLPRCVTLCASDGSVENQHWLLWSN